MIGVFFGVVYFPKMKDWAISCLWKILPKSFSAEGLSQHPGRPRRWQGNALWPGLERFELELFYLDLTLLLLLDLAQTSKVSHSQIFLRLVMRYQSLT